MSGRLFLGCITQPNSTLPQSLMNRFILKSHPWPKKAKPTPLIVLQLTEAEAKPLATSPTNEINHFYQFERAVSIVKWFHAAVATTALKAFRCSWIDVCPHRCPRMSILDPSSGNARFSQLRHSRACWRRRLEMATCWRAPHVVAKAQCVAHGPQHYIFRWNTQISTWSLPRVRLGRFPGATLF